MSAKQGSRQVLIFAKVAAFSRIPLSVRLRVNKRMSRISIGVRLAIAFTFLVSILIVVGWLGLNRMARINADLNDINYRRWSKLQLAQEALTYSNMNNRLLQGAILSGRKEEVASLQGQRERNTKRIADIIQTLN